jgi:hypothetical protein
MKSLKIDKGEITIAFTDTPSGAFIEYNLEKKSFED